MKRTLIAGAFVLIAAGEVFAADFPIPAQSAQPLANYAPPTAINWGGFYIGINSGYGFGTSDWSAAGGDIGLFNTSGLLLGGTLGLNVQAGSFILGIEGDGDWTNLKGSSSNAYCSSVTGNATCETKSDFMGTVRLRVGYAFDRILVYGTGGAAIVDILAGLNPPNTFDKSITVGWTAGGGIEVAFAENWSAKLEYLYVDFGSISCTSANCGSAVPITVPLTENIVRAGVNFKFGPW